METLVCDLDECPIYGCLDETAINYNPEADTNDGSCYHDTVTDIDDNEYIDYALAAGPMILGHAPTKVLDAVRDSLEEGQLYYGQHEREIILAKKIIEIIQSFLLLLVWHLDLAGHPA